MPARKAEKLSVPLSSAEPLVVASSVLETDDHAPRVAFADAQCAGGTLIVAHLDAAPRDLPSRILDHVMGSDNYHPIEYQTFFMNLWQNAVARTAAFSAARSQPARDPE